MTGLTKRPEHEASYPTDREKERRFKRPWVRETLMVALAAEMMDNKGRKTKKLRMIVDRLVNAALDGEGWAIKEIFDRVDGKPTQTIAGDPDNPIGGVGVLGGFIVEYVRSSESTQDPIDITPTKEAEAAGENDNEKQKIVREQ